MNTNFTFNLGKVSFQGFCLENINITCNCELSDAEFNKTIDDQHEYFNQVMEGLANLPVWLNDNSCHMAAAIQTIKTIKN